MKPSYRVGLEKLLESRIRAIQCTNAPQINVVADVTHGDDELNLMPEIAEGSATPEGIPHIVSFF